jgi:hypothetical protein
MTHPTFISCDDIVSELFTFTFKQRQKLLGDVHLLLFQFVTFIARTCLGSPDLQSLPEVARENARYDSSCRETRRLLLMSQNTIPGNLVGCRSWPSAPFFATRSGTPTEGFLQDQVQANVTRY